MKRIFIAIPITGELQVEILQWQEKHRDLPVRWIKGKNLHVTLVPPWYAENASLPAKLLGEGDSVTEVAEKLKTFKDKFGTFEIKFEHVSLGPDPNQPRMIWAQGSTPSRLLDLKDRVFDTLGREPEVRPFRLHITLARFRPEDLKKFPQKELDEKVEWGQQVDHIALYESHLSGQGADYEVLEKIRIGR